MTRPSTLPTGIDAFKPNLALSWGAQGQDKQAFIVPQAIAILASLAFLLCVVSWHKAFWFLVGRDCFACVCERAQLATWTSSQQDIFTLLTKLSSIHNGAVMISVLLSLLVPRVPLLQLLSPFPHKLSIIINNDNDNSNHWWLLYKLLLIDLWGKGDHFLLFLADQFLVTLNIPEYLLFLADQFLLTLNIPQCLLFLTESIPRHLKYPSMFPFSQRSIPRVGLSGLQRPKNMPVFATFCEDWSGNLSVTCSWQCCH